MAISFISVLLVFKILVTFVSVCLPALVLPPSRLGVLTGVTDPAGLLFRLYGAAILALLIGYASAFPAVLAGEFPWGIIVMGTVSNGAASVILFRLGTGRAKASAAPLFGAIFLGLVLCLIAPESAMAPLF